MSDGASVTIVNAWLDSILNGVAPTTYDDPWVQLHVGAPGADGTVNVAGETTRIQATGTWIIVSGLSTNPDAVTWVNVSTSETYTNVSLWSDPTDGTFLCSGTITAGAVEPGDNFEIPSGDMTVTQPTAS
jgi:hypothetical protein